ncbi:MAG: (Fe-S)-binding protein [Deltaproteobacteria bacterium]|nr:(Fe-S)-binding protein [Deltaproteobacteria bacterium]
MTAKTYIDAFDPEGKSLSTCETCGLCLQRCPVMKMEKEASRAEMGRLLKGHETERVLNACTFCFNCNQYCPHGLKPYALIMERAAEKNQVKEKGLPPYVDYLLTGKGKASLFGDVYLTETAKEKAVLDTWEHLPSKSREVLFIGCVGREIPYGIEHSKVFADVPKYAPRNACCGELAYRYGDYQAFAETVERTRAMLERLDTERLVCYCGSCANYLGNIWPNYHGVKLPFEIVSVWEWLWEKYTNGSIEVARPIDRRVALTDACYGSELGEGFMDAVRGLHRAVGMTVVELENNRGDNLTCGTVSILRNNYDLGEGAKETKKKIAQVLNTGVNDLTCYCPGCFMQLRGASRGVNIKTHYALEEILWAFGDDYPVALEERAAKQTEFFIDKVKASFAG